MQKVFIDVKDLEKRMHEAFGITEDVMIENAASALEAEVRKALYDRNIVRTSEKRPAHRTEQSSISCAALHAARSRASQPYLVSASSLDVLIVCGSGNNGADGYALARRILGDIPAAVYASFDAKTENCKRERDAALATGVKLVSRSSFLKRLASCALVVDCLYGTGFHGTLMPDVSALIDKINKAPCFRIACDIPSGIDKRGAVSTEYKHTALAFNADVTVAMGALKAAYFGDVAKDFCGIIKKYGIGVSGCVFEAGRAADLYLLEAGDMSLPVRTKKSVHKGHFGHAVIAAGEKAGAAIIAGEAALGFGAGLATLVETEKGAASRFKLPSDLMIAKSFPQNTTAILLGSGFGRDRTDAFQSVCAHIEEHKGAGIVLDADSFYYGDIVNLLDALAKRRTRVVLTPHPKEFQSLLKLCSLGDYTIAEIADDRIEIVKKFSARFPHTVLVLKGANTVIASERGVFVSVEGNQSLAKAGSGDVLAGLVCALLAERYGAEDAAVTAVLAHGIASQRFARSYNLTPPKLIDAVGGLMSGLQSM
ncbi:NAD(P)H-hydrate dehydratase [Treponema sp. Marseille-Q4130]|uniref:NAD(P)H-hydrate dehydratase n=1 Tax=Treponema sp. Marseille-Q4130 TaxID=2766702 RepID=UPI001652469C|nr:NAD(P)H-hydrate dehydratase [Treponema sp. Marseille-Q4130]MBC6718933.1 NAD(P)H-hydrate dehydratase [Treponema sp. Marseille-Q4130]